VIVRKSAAEIEGMARAGEVVAGTIALLGGLAQPGLTTGELDRLAEDYIREHGGVPTSKGYRGFPAATCISPNSMVVHGIPGAHRVEEGDLISVDVGVTLDGLVADSAYTFAIGEVDPELQRLLDVGKDALAAGIDQLSETLRTTLILVCIDGRSHEDVAAILGAPEGTIAWRVHEARRKLKEYMQARGFDPEGDGT